MNKVAINVNESMTSNLHISVPSKLSFKRKPQICQ